MRSARLCGKYLKIRPEGPLSHTYPRARPRGDSGAFVATRSRTWRRRRKSSKASPAYWRTADADKPSPCGRISRHWQRSPRIGSTIDLYSDVAVGRQKEAAGRYDEALAAALTTTATTVFCSAAARTAAKSSERDGRRCRRKQKIPVNQRSVDWNQSADRRSIRCYCSTHYPSASQTRGDSMQQIHIAKIWTDES